MWNDDVYITEKETERFNFLFEQSLTLQNSYSFSRRRSEHHLEVYYEVHSVDVHLLSVSNNVDLCWCEILLNVEL